MQETYRPLSKHYHLQNAHNKDFELSGLTHGSRSMNDRYTKKQHFIQGKVRRLLSSDTGEPGAMCTYIAVPYICTCA